MTLLDRVKERTGAELSDSELTDMIAGIATEIESRYGPTGEISVTIGDPDISHRSLATLKLQRPIDEALPIAIVEIDPADSGQAEAETELAPADYRVLHTGRTLQRLTGGPNGQKFWAPFVRVTYTPIGSQAARDDVTIKLMQLDLGYRGLIKSERAGDYQWSGSLASDSYATERENLLASLASGNRLVMA